MGKHLSVARTGNVGSDATLRMTSSFVVGCSFVVGWSLAALMLLFVGCGPLTTETPSERFEGTADELRGKAKGKRTRGDEVPEVIDCATGAITVPQASLVGSSVSVSINVNNAGAADAVCRTDYYFERATGDLFLAAGIGGMSAQVVLANSGGDASDSTRPNRNRRPLPPQGLLGGCRSE